MHRLVGRSTNTAKNLVSVSKLQGYIFSLLNLFCKFNKFLIDKKCYCLSLRLKAVEILLNAMDDVNQQLSDHEHSLLSHDTMSSDRDALRSLQNQLKVSYNNVDQWKFSYNFLKSS